MSDRKNINDTDSQVQGYMGRRDFLNRSAKLAAGLATIYASFNITKPVYASFEAGLETGLAQQSMLIHDKEDVVGLPQSQKWQNTDNPDTRYEVLDALPSVTAGKSVWPIEEASALVQTSHGYHHFQPTYHENYKSDGGHHLGQDFSRGKGNDDTGLPLRNIFTGLCVYIGTATAYDLGNMVMMRYLMPDKTSYFMRYCHLKDFGVGVEVGKMIPAGDTIGTMGRSGWEGGISHLHLDVATELLYNERYISKKNPYFYPHIAGKDYIDERYIDPVSLIIKYSDEPKACIHAPDDMSYNKNPNYCFGNPKDRPDVIVAKSVARDRKER